MRPEKDIHRSCPINWTRTCLDGARLIDGDRLGGLSIGRAKFFNRSDDIHSFQNFSKHNVFPIKPSSDDLHPHQLNSYDRSIINGAFGGKGTVVTKNCDPLVLGPAFAMERRPGLECFNLKFSSANFSP